MGRVDLLGNTESGRKIKPATTLAAVMGKARRGVCPRHGEAETNQVSRARQHTILPGTWWMAVLVGAIMSNNPKVSCLRAAMCQALL